MSEGIGRVEKLKKCLASSMDDPYEGEIKRYFMAGFEKF